MFLNETKEGGNVIVFLQKESGSRKNEAILFSELIRYYTLLPVLELKTFLVGFCG